MIKKLLTWYLLLYLFLPVRFLSSAFAKVPAAVPPKVAILSVYGDTPSQELETLRIQIEKHLLKSHAVVLIPKADLLAALKNLEVKKPQSIKGDQIFYQAEEVFYGFNPDKSWDLLQASIVELQKDPGISGNLGKAYLLKAQLEQYKDKPDAAYQSVLKAVALNLAQIELSEFAYDPKIRALYAKAHREFVEEHPVKNLKINSSGSVQTPIYVNGVLRGRGSQLEVLVPKNQIQMVRVGENQEVMFVRDQNRIRIPRPRHSKTKSHKQLPALKDQGPAQTKQTLYEVGQVTGADAVASLEWKDHFKKKKLRVMVLDVRHKKVVNDEFFEFENGSKSALQSIGNSVAALLPKNAVARKPETVTKKPHKSFLKSPASKLILGVVVAGAISGIALGVAGNSGGSGDLSSASVSGPIPVLASD